MKKISVLILSTLIMMFYTMPVMAEMVIYNTKTGKYHSLDCKWAKQCTVNCIKIDKKEAKKRGGIPCKICGG